jgi:hypothetical protein
MKIRNAWTPEEIAALHRYYPEHGNVGSVAFIPGRSASSIREKAHQLGIKMTDEAKHRIRVEIAKATNNLASANAEPFTAKPQYIQAASIWEVSRRYAIDARASA